MLRRSSYIFTEHPLLMDQDNATGGCDSLDIVFLTVVGANVRDGGQE